MLIYFNKQLKLKDSLQIIREIPFIKPQNDT